MESTVDSVRSPAKRREAEAIDLPAVPMGQTPLDKFREYLDVRGLKCTGERMRIVEHVFEKHNHFDADQLVASMKDRGLAVSRSTVYRTLSLLVEAGLLRTLDFGPSAAYEHDYGYPHHEHLFCEKCRRAIEFVSEELARLQEEVCRMHRFRATDHTFVIRGVCEDCGRARTNQRRLDLI